MRRRVLNCGYVPLVDSAPLILAKQLGFAADEGLTLNLLRQPSWSALRDLLALGHLDAAHMLSPMLAAMRLGLSGKRVDVDAPLVLSVNGTVIGVSTALAKRMRDAGWRGDIADPVHFVTILRAATSARIRVGVPFPFSMHRLLFEYLLSGFADFRQNRIEIITTPPPLMADAVANDDIDVFCVGEPWGTVAVQSGVAELVLPGSAIWSHAPEKVLGLRRDWIEANDALSGALIRAVHRASEWLGKSENLPFAGEILASSEHLNLPDLAIDPALTGQIVPRPGEAPWRVDNFLKFHAGATTFPQRAHGAWIGLQIAGLHGVAEQDAVRAGADCLRPDLYLRHLGLSRRNLLDAPAMGQGGLHDRAVKEEMILHEDAFFDGRSFDLAAYE